MPLIEPQRKILGGIAVALALTFAGIFAAPFIEALPRPSPGRGARIEFALQWELLLALCLIANVAIIAKHRFLTPEDMDGGGLTAGTAKVKVLQATLQNTLEQVVIAALVHLSWAAMMPVAWQASLPVATILFVLGRLAFWRGYSRGAPSRAMGFGLTFYPSVVMAATLVVHALFDVPGN